MTYSIYTLVEQLFAVVFGQVTEQNASEISHLGNSLVFDLFWIYL